MSYKTTIKDKIIVEKVLMGPKKKIRV